MHKEIQFNKYVNLKDLKPEVGQDGIFFPVAIVEHVDLDEYHDDARSFSYHFDDGYCTVVKYEQAVGTLADDTIVLFNKCAEIKAHMKKPHHYMLEITNDETECDIDKAELLIRYDSEYFYKDDYGYFFMTQYFDYGNPQRVTDESAEIYREVNREYQRQIKNYNKLMQEALDNMKLLKATIIQN